MCLLKEAKMSEVKWKIPKSIALYLLFIGMGLISSVMGPTLVTMEQMLDTDTKTLSYAFTSCSLGFLTGAVLCGVCFDRVSRELLLVIFGALQSVSVGLAPWTGNLYIFMVLVYFVGMGLGFTDPAGNPYSLMLWGRHRIQNPFVQALHCMWSVGSMLGPFITRPFLLSLHTLGNSTTDLQVSSNHSYVSADEDASDPGMVRFAYVCVGSVSLMASIAFLALYLLSGCQLLNPHQAPTGQHRLQQDDCNAEYKSFRIKLLSLMCLYYVLYVGYEGTTGKFISIFVTKHLGWDVKTAALATSAFWAAVGTGRFINIFVSAILPPKTMLLLNFMGTIIAFILMLFVKYHVVVVWISLTLAGISMSSTFATGVLWVSQYIPVTGVASAIFLIGSSIASISLPPFVGYMFQMFSPMWMVYVLLTCSVSHLALFIGLHFYTSYFISSVTKKAEAEASQLKPLKSIRNQSDILVVQIPKAVNT